MNTLERLKHACAALRCVVLLLFALLVISHPREAVAAVATPASLAVSSTSGAQITVMWGASTGAARYQVERATNSAGPYSVVGNPTANSFADGSVAANTTYGAFPIKVLNAAHLGFSTSKSEAATSPTGRGGLTPGLATLLAA
jgi:hypothetical protein